jgi:hypothetical protein
VRFVVRPLRAAGAMYVGLPPEGRALAYRVGMGILVGLVVFVLVDLAWELVLAGAECTKCSVAGNPGGLAGAGFGGGAAAAGGDDDPPGKGRFDNWMDDLFGGGGGPPKSVEPVSPEERQQMEDDARRGFEIYKHGIGSEGLVEPEEGSAFDELNKAFDRFLDFSSGETDVGPGLPPDDSGTVSRVGDDGR